MDNKVIIEEATNEEIAHYNFLIQNLFSTIFKGSKVSRDDQEKVFGRLEEEITGRPFRVAIIGQSGVGKSSTLNAVFGLDLPTSDIEEGTTEIIEKIFPMRDGFKLSIFDMPGLLQSRRKDKEYEQMYREILPKCDVIVYIIKANTRNIGDDCRILKDIVLPICNENAVKDNLIIAVNKVDIIGESFAPGDPELVWNPATNVPTPKMLECMQKRRLDIFEKLIGEGLVLSHSDSAVSPEQVVFYSAIWHYNLNNFLLAITRAGKRGFIWTSTIGYDLLMESEKNK